MVEACKSLGNSQRSCLKVRKRHELLSTHAPSICKGLEKPTSKNGISHMKTSLENGLLKIRSMVYPLLATLGQLTMPGPLVESYPGQRQEELATAGRRGTCGCEISVGIRLRGEVWGACMVGRVPELVPESDSLIMLPPDTRFGMKK